MSDPFPAIQRKAQVVAEAVRALVDDGLPVGAAQIIVANQHERDKTADLMAYASRLIAARQSPMGRQARREP